MKAGKKISTLLLSLGCVLLLNGCGDSASPTPSPSTMTVAQADAKLQEAKENLRRLQSAPQAPRASPAEIQKLQVEANRLSKIAGTAQAQADTMRQQSRTTGHDPDSPRDSPRTYKAIQKANGAQAQAADAQRALDEARKKGEGSSDAVAKAQEAVTQATKELDEAKARTQSASASPLASSPAGADGWRAILLTWLPSLLTTASLLVVMILLHRSTMRKLEQTAGIFSGKLSGLTAEQATLASDVRSMIVKSLKDSPELSALGTKLERFDATLNEIQRVVADRSKDTGNETDSNVETEAEDKGPSFPISAEDYLSSMQDKLVYVKPDYPNTTLIKDSENGDLALVSAHSNPAGMYYLVPKLSRFPTKQDYYTVYEQYFECNQPYSGAVTIIRPAMVYAVDGGWQLDQKGQLKVG